MAHSYTVEVTDEDVDLGVCNDGQNCIYAIAVKRAIPQATRPWVDAEKVAFTIGRYRFTYIVRDKAVADTIRAFDQKDYDNVKPVALHLRNPEIKELVRRGGSPRLPKGAGRQTTYVKPTPKRNRLMGQAIRRLSETA